jgi:hypothetical protein
MIALWAAVTLVHEMITLARQMGFFYSYLEPITAPAFSLPNNGNNGLQLKGRRWLANYGARHTPFKKNGSSTLATAFSFFCRRNLLSFVGKTCRFLFVSPCPL